MKPKLIISEKNGDIRWTAPNEETIEFVIKNVIPNDSNYVFMYDDSDIDYSFNFCYDFNFDDENGATAIPSFNLEKAKEIHMQHIRKKRSKIFPQLDIEYMIALESGDSIKMQEVATKKQALRDVTEIDFSNVTTPIELKAKWPTDILGESPYTNI